MDEEPVKLARYLLDVDKAWECATRDDVMALAKAVLDMSGEIGRLRQSIVASKDLRTEIAVVAQDAAMVRIQLAHLQDALREALDALDEHEENSGVRQLRVGRVAELRKLATP